MKLTIFLCILALFSGRLSAQKPFNSDSLFAVIDSTSLVRAHRPPPEFRNSELYRLVLQDSAEHSHFISHYFELTSEHPEVVSRLATRDSVRRAFVSRSAAGLLAYGTKKELEAASRILQGVQLGGDTNYYWNAYRLASRAVSMGDSDASPLAEHALGQYLAKRGNRVNADSILAAWQKLSPTDSDTSEHWIPSFSAALAEAKRTHRNLFIDFTGYTTTNAREMEASIFSREDVKTLLKTMVLARLYMDNGTPLNDSNAKLEESRFQTRAGPFYAIVSPENSVLETFPGFTRDIETFKRFLRLEQTKTGRKK